VDRVIRPGVAYEFLEGDSGDGVPRGLLQARIALVFNTSNTPVQREQEAFGDPLQTLWKNCIFGLCGIGDFRRKSYGVVVTSTKEQRQAWLDDVRETVRQCFPAWYVFSWPASQLAFGDYSILSVPKLPVSS
jgi:NAD(P)H dehydrogenase (quinone)